MVSLEEEEELLAFPLPEVETVYGVGTKPLPIKASLLLRVGLALNVRAANKFSTVQPRSCLPRLSLNTSQGLNQVWDPIQQLVVTNEIAGGWGDPRIDQKVEEEAGRPRILEIRDLQEEARLHLGQLQKPLPATERLEVASTDTKERPNTAATSAKAPAKGGKAKVTSKMQTALLYISQPMQGHRNGGLSRCSKCLSGAHHYNKCRHRHTTPFCKRCEKQGGSFPCCKDYRWQWKLQGSFLPSLDRNVP